MGTVRVKHWRVWCIGECQFETTMITADTLGSYDAKQLGVEWHREAQPGCHLGSTGVEVDEDYGKEAEQED